MKSVIEEDTDLLDLDEKKPKSEEEAEAELQQEPKTLKARCAGIQRRLEEKSCKAGRVTSIGWDVG